MKSGLMLFFKDNSHGLKKKILVLLIVWEGCGRGLILPFPHSALQFLIL